MKIISILSTIIILLNPVANIHIKLKSITSKLYNTFACTALIKKALFVNGTPKLEIVKEQIINVLSFFNFYLEYLTGAKKMGASEESSISKD